MPCLRCSVLPSTTKMTSTTWPRGCLSFTDSGRRGLMRVEKHGTDRWSAFDSGIGSMATLCLNLSHDRCPQPPEMPSCCPGWQSTLSCLLESRPEPSEALMRLVLQLEVRGRTGEPRPWEFTETLMQPKLRQRSTSAQSTMLQLCHTRAQVQRGSWRL